VAHEEKSLAREGAVGVSPGPAGARLILSWSRIWGT